MILRTVLAVLAAFLPVAALAHAGHPSGAGLAAGLFHPLAGADHALAALAVGLWAARLEAKSAMTLVGGFSIAIAAGIVLGMTILPISAFELGLAGSVVLLGAAIALDWRARAGVAMALVGAFGLIHGQAHGVEMPEAAVPFAYAFGLILATTALTTAGWAIGRTMNSRRLAQALGGAALVAGAFLAAG